MSHGLATLSHVRRWSRQQALTGHKANKHAPMVKLEALQLANHSLIIHPSTAAPCPMTRQELMTQAYSLLAELAALSPNTEEHKELRREYYLLTVVYTMLNENTAPLLTTNHHHAV